jgi:hypothetical protein
MSPNTDGESGSSIALPMKIQTCTSHVTVMYTRKLHDMVLARLSTKLASGEGGSNEFDLWFHEQMCSPDYNVL